LALAETENFVTAQFAVVGTPSYMSPEQINGEKLTYKSDLFSLGIVIYEMLLGKNPFLGKDVNESINNIISFRDEELNGELNNLSENFSKLIKELLHRNPEFRISSCAEALKIIGLEIQEKGNGRTEKKKRTMKILPFVIIGSACIVIIYFLIFFERSSLSDIENESLPLEYDSSKLLSNKIPEQSIEVNDSSISNKKVAIQNPNKLVSLKVTTENPDTPLITKEKGNDNEIIEKYGDLHIECYPWGDIYIDSRKVDTTPLNKPIKLNTGEYLLRLIHPDYPEFDQKIDIFDGETTSVKVNLDTLFGYLDCRIYPWGEIFINGEKRGDTPLEKPLRLFPGEYQLTVKNPNYRSKTDYIVVDRNDTLKLKYFLDRN
jgi:serine/threonine-protein kinase